LLRLRHSLDQALQMRGCGAVQPLQGRYAQAARAAGVAAVIDGSRPTEGDLIGLAVTRRFKACAAKP
jgi:hypothetical protein